MGRQNQHKKPKNHPQKNFLLLIFVGK